MKTNNVTVLVTGGCGHIGSYIIEHLCQTLTNSKIICVDNLYNGKLSNLDESNKLALKNNNVIKVKKINVASTYEMEEVFTSTPPDYVFHHASMLTLDSKLDRLAAVKVNIGGMSNVLDMCLLCLVWPTSLSVAWPSCIWFRDTCHD